VHHLFRGKKVAQKFGQRLQLPEENNRPMGESSPNLVTL
jgi:hypothetical protein